MIEKLLLEKFKKQLGSKYELYDNDLFERKYTHVSHVYGNQMSQINYDAFEKNGNKILGTVQVLPGQYSVTSFTAINTTYTLTLWVPINYNMVNSKGEYLVEPKFNIEADLIALREAFNNKTIDFGDGYKGEITFSEPSSSGSYDNSGSYKRKAVVISGKINFTTKVYYGRDYKIKLGRIVTSENEDGEINEEIEYLTVNDITSLNFTPQSTPIENHEQGDLIPEESVEAVKQACLFSLDDTCQDEELNDILTYLALSGETSKEPYYLSISKRKSEEFIEYVNYPVYLNVNLVYQLGNSDVGTFTVTCMRCKQ